jgi:hypothetical protein
LTRASPRTRPTPFRHLPKTATQLSKRLRSSTVAPRHTIQAPRASPTAPRFASTAVARGLAPHVQATRAREAGAARRHKTSARPRAMRFLTNTHRPRHRLRRPRVAHTFNTRTTTSQTKTTNCSRPSQWTSARPPAATRRPSTRPSSRRSSHASPSTTTEGQARATSRTSTSTQTASPWPQTPRSTSTPPRGPRRLLLHRHPRPRPRRPRRVPRPHHRIRRLRPRPRRPRLLLCHHHPRPRHRLLHPRRLRHCTLNKAQTPPTPPLGLSLLSRSF